MKEQNFPITDKYKLGVNVNLELGVAFWEASHGQPMEDRLVGLPRALVGRKIDVCPNSWGDNGYNVMRGRLLLDMGVSDVASFVSKFMHVSPDNLPLNIPDELTPELVVFLVALHESEHVMQWGEVGAKSTASTFAKGKTYENKDIPFVIMQEADADSPVIKYLREDGKGNVAQFWLDMRTVSSFTDKFPLMYPAKYVDNFASVLNPLGDWGYKVDSRKYLRKSMSELYGHDSASILAYSEKNGAVIDPEYYLREKEALVKNVHESMEIEESWFISLVNRCRDEGERTPTVSEAVNVMKNISPMSPQKIRYALDDLMGRGSLDGLQRLEAENFIAAAERMGYEADPDPDFVQIYKDQVCDAVGNMYGVNGLDREAHYLQI